VSIHILEVADDHVLTVDSPVVQVIEVGVAGPQGPPGAAAQGYEHTQSSAATTWTVNHSLGYRPIVEVFTSGGVLLWGQVTHTSVNQFTVNFNTAQAGFARAI
jgi:hypothetical protein